MVKTKSHVQINKKDKENDSWNYDDSTGYIYNMMPFFGPLLHLNRLLAYQRDHKEKIKSEKEERKGLEAEIDKLEKELSTKEPGDEEESIEDEKERRLREHYEKDFSPNEHYKVDYAVEKIYGPVKEIVERYGYEGLKALREEVIREGLNNEDGLPSYLREEEKEKGRYNERADEDGLEGKVNDAGLEGRESEEGISYIASFDLNKSGFYKLREDMKKDLGEDYTNMLEETILKGAAFQLYKQGFDFSGLSFDNNDSPYTSFMKYFMKQRSAEEARRADISLTQTFESAYMDVKSGFESDAYENEESKGKEKKSTYEEKNEQDDIIDVDFTKREEGYLK